MLPLLLRRGRLVVVAAAAAAPRCCRPAVMAADPRRGFALPIPLFVKVSQVVVKLLPTVMTVARPAVVYAMRWWPYYCVKYGIVHTIRQYGARRVYQHVARASQRLVHDDIERRRVRGVVKSLLRTPATVQSGVVARMAMVDSFLLDWAMEASVPTPRHVWRGCPDLESQLRSGARQAHAAASRFHSIGPDMEPTVVGMELCVRVDTVRSVATRKLLPGAKHQIFVWDRGLTVFGLKALLAEKHTMCLHRVKLQRPDESVLGNDEATLGESLLRCFVPSAQPPSLPKIRTTVDSEEMRT